MAASPDQDLRPRRRGARIPVRVADRHRRDRRGPLQLVALAVAEALAGGQPPRHRHGRAPRQRRAEPPSPRRPRRPAGSRRARSRAHEVERRLGVPDHRAAVRRVHEAGLDAGGAGSLDDPREPVQLSLRRDLIVLALREMGPQTLDLEAGRATRRGTRRILGRPDPDPVHPGVDLYVDRDRRPGRRRRAARGLHPCTAWGSGGAPKPRPRARGGTPRARGSGCDPRHAEPEALLDERNPQPRRAGLERGTGHRDLAVPVRVRLHDGHQLGAVRLEDRTLWRIASRSTRRVSGGTGRSRRDARVSRLGPHEVDRGGQGSATSPASVPSPKSRPRGYPPAREVRAGPRGVERLQSREPAARRSCR